MQGKNNGERKNRVKKIEDSSYSLFLHFWSTSRSPFSTCYIPFQSSGSQKSNASNSVRFRVETNELQPLQSDHSKLKEDFARLRNQPFVVINFVDYSLNQGAPAGHEAAETPIGHESNGAVAGDGATLHCACHIEYEIAEEAMNFMSYVAEVSRGWDEPNARDMGRMTSQPNAKGEMYILNDSIDMKAKIAAIARRLEELEMKKMEMFGDCNTYNSNWRDHPNFSWKPQPPQYKQHVQALPQASSLEQAMVNLSKFVEDFVGAQKSINAQLSQRIDSVESSLIKRMDEGIHVVEAQEEESSMVKEVKTVITLSGKEVDLPTCKLEHKRTTEDSHQGRIDEETHASTFSPSFVWQNHTEKAPRGIAKKLKGSLSEQKGSKTWQKQGKNRGLRDFATSAKSALCCKTNSQPQAPLCEIFAAAKPILAHECHFAAQEPLFCSCETAAKLQNVKNPNFATKAPFGRVFRNCETNFWHTSAISQHSESHFAAAKCCETNFWHTSAISQHSDLISQLRNDCKMPKPAKWAAKSPLGCEMVCELRNGCEITSKLRNGLQIAKLTCEMQQEESPAHPGITHTKPLTPFLNLLKPSNLIAPVEETMPPKEITRTEVKVLIQPIQEATTDASTPQDLTIT
ncbi:hypothetical protein CK203_091769 [Vitis vinifera]|uniref:Uncharacterized protein n=1 Tax=Vitis vinifera TaxID=29760 RepID=A0A438EJC0_VITVI|nr:hypothetical protein CK203_091769 [Vitis vinifera]